MNKEELAAKLRELLNVSVKFEKLNKDELQELYNAVQELIRKKFVDTEVEKVESPFIFGIIPAIRDQVTKVIPQVRREVRKTIEETVKNIFNEKKSKTR